MKKWSSLLFITITVILTGIFLFFYAVRVLLEIYEVYDGYDIVSGGVSVLPGYYLSLLWSQILIVIGNILLYVCLIPLVQKDGTTSDWYERGIYFSFLLIPCMWLIGDNGNGSLIINMFASLWVGSFSDNNLVTYCMNSGYSWGYVYHVHGVISTTTIYGSLDFVAYLFLLTGVLLFRGLWRFRRNQMSSLNFSLLIVASLMPFGGFLTLSVLSLISGGISVLPIFIPIPHTILVSFFFFFKGPLPLSDSERIEHEYQEIPRGRFWGISQTGKTDKDILEVRLANIHSKRGQKEDRN